MANTSAAKARIFLISERFGSSAGGEAIKSQQYADFLRESGHELVVFTHARARGHGLFLPEAQLRTVPDTGLQRFMWRVAPLRGCLSIYFHLKVRPMIAAEAATGATPILHYISPVSPVALRFPLRGYKAVLGPLTGNIYYPPAFRSRMSWKDRFRERLHAVSQVVLGWTFREKLRFDTVLVSGYERTRASLRLAGCPEQRMVDVVDSGVSAAIFQNPRLQHAGVNPRFVCSGRLVDHKGTDLAIRAVAKAGPTICLDIFGDGEKRPELTALVVRLGLQDRVIFKGWVASHDDLLAAYAAYRGYLFASLAEANGIVMQEAMAIGLPVIALRWGGPAMLGDAGSAILVETTSDETVVAGLAKALDRLAQDAALADIISAKARARAEAKFTWESVAESWQRAYQTQV